MPLKLEALDPLESLQGLDDLSGSLHGTATASAATGQPLMLPVSDIDEDPAQPRTEFDAEALGELAATIQARGVLQPISVRQHPQRPGRWMLNFGARRLRASVLAGKPVIPAFVDPVPDDYAQVIENEQRQALTPLDLALFIQARLAQGDSLADIGRHLGKSRSYVSFATALIDPPGWLLGLYRAGACRGLRELYELKRLHETSGVAVEAWVQGRASVSRTEIDELKACLRAPVQKLPPATASVPVGEPETAARPTGRVVPLNTLAPVSAATAAAAAVRHLWAQLDGQAWVRISFDAQRLADGQVLVSHPATSKTEVVDAARVQLRGAYQQPPTQTAPVIDPKRA